jgi:hypothetical protein
MSKPHAAARGNTLKMVFATGAIGVVVLSLLPGKHVPSFFPDTPEQLMA